MDVDVAFLPSLLTAPERQVCVVVDVLRASTSLATMFARGLEEAVVARSIDEARQIAAHGNYLLCGEQDGLPPPGFDYGNSPSEFSTLNLWGRRAVFVTSNGTRALAACAGAPAVLVGSLVNATAVCRLAATEAVQHGASVAFVCAGNGFGTQFSLDDAVACGLLVQTLAQRYGNELHLKDGAKAAQCLSDAYSGQALRAFRDSSHGAHVQRIGLGHDLLFCAQIDRYAVVPVLARTEGGRLWLQGRNVD